MTADDRPSSPTASTDGAEADRQQDQWAAWLGTRRHGGDLHLRAQLLEVLGPVRDRVLTNARITSGAQVLDVGCGDGLIAFAALDAVGPSGEVVFSDVSAQLLDQCRQLAADADLIERCRFVEAPAKDLSAVEDGSVDAVTLRSVLIYEEEKAQAFSEFHRVLRPAGRLSLFEPINRFGFPEPPGRFIGYDVSPVTEIAQKVEAIYEAIQPPDRDPMLDFDERDLVRMAEDAGFEEVHLALEVNVEPPRSRPWQRSWEALLNSSGNPRVPTLAEAMSQALSPDEAQRLTVHLRPLVDRGEGQARSASAYLWAVR